MVNYGDLLIEKAILSYIRLNGSNMNQITNFDALNNALKLFDASKLSEQDKNVIYMHFNAALQSKEYDAFLRDVEYFTAKIEDLDSNKDENKEKKEDKRIQGTNINSYGNTIIDLEKQAAKEGKSLYTPLTNLFAKVFRKRNEQRVARETYENTTFSTKNYYDSFKQFPKSKVNLTPGNYFKAISGFSFFNRFIKDNQKTYDLSDEVPQRFLFQDALGSKQMNDTELNYFRHILGNEAADLFEDVSRTYLRNSDYVQYEDVLDDNTSSEESKRYAANRVKHNRAVEIGLFDKIGKHVQTLDIPVEAMVERVNYTNIAISFAVARDIELNLNLIEEKSDNVNHNVENNNETKEEKSVYIIPNKMNIRPQEWITYNLLNNGLPEGYKENIVDKIRNRVNQENLKEGLRKQDLTRRIVNNMKVFGGFASEKNFDSMFETVVRNSVRQQDQAISFAMLRRLEQTLVKEDGFQERYVQLHASQQFSDKQMKVLNSDSFQICDDMIDESELDVYRQALLKVRDIIQVPNEGTINNRNYERSVSEKNDLKNQIMEDILIGLTVRGALINPSIETFHDDLVDSIKDIAADRNIQQEDIQQIEAINNIFPLEETEDISVKQDASPILDSEKTIILPAGTFEQHKEGSLDDESSIKPESSEIITEEVPVENLEGAYETETHYEEEVKDSSNETPFEEESEEESQDKNLDTVEVEKNVDDVNINGIMDFVSEKEDTNEQKQPQQENSYSNTVRHSQLGNRWSGQPANRRNASNLSYAAKKRQEREAKGIYNQIEDPTKYRFQANPNAGTLDETTNPFSYVKESNEEIIGEPKQNQDIEIEKNNHAVMSEILEDVQEKTGANIDNTHNRYGNLTEADAKRINELLSKGMSHGNHEHTFATQHDISENLGKKKPVLKANNIRLNKVKLIYENGMYFPTRASANLWAAGQLFIKGNPEFKNIEFIGACKKGPGFAYYITENQNGEHQTYVYNRNAIADENHPIEFREITEDEFKDNNITSKYMRGKINKMKDEMDRETRNEIRLNSPVNEEKKEYTQEELFDDLPLETKVQDGKDGQNPDEPTAKKEQEEEQGLGL